MSDCLFSLFCQQLWVGLGWVILVLVYFLFVYPFSCYLSFSSSTINCSFDSSLIILLLLELGLFKHELEYIRFEPLIFLWWQDSNFNTRFCLILFIFLVFFSAFQSAASTSGPEMSVVAVLQLDCPTLYFIPLNPLTSHTNAMTKRRRGAQTTCEPFSLYFSSTNCRMPILFFLLTLYLPAGHNVENATAYFLLKRHHQPTLYSTRPFLVLSLRSAWRRMAL